MKNHFKDHKKSLGLFAFGLVAGLGFTLISATISIQTPTVNPGDIITSAGWNKIKADLQALAAASWDKTGTFLTYTGGNVGIGTANPGAKLDVNGDLIIESLKSCPSLSTDATGKLICNTGSYSWSTGNWGNCSTTCGGGTQTRSVTCLRSDNTTVADSFCSGTKPTTSQTCNTQSCLFANFNGRSYTSTSGQNGMKHDASGDAVGTSTASCTGYSDQIVCDVSYVEYYGRNLPAGWTGRLVFTSSGTRSLGAVTITLAADGTSMQFQHATAYTSFTKIWR